MDKSDFAKLPMEYGDTLLDVITQAGTISCPCCGTICSLEQVVYSKFAGIRICWKCAKGEVEAGKPIPYAEWPHVLEFETWFKEKARRRE